MEFLNFINSSIEQVLHFAYHRPVIWMSFRIKVFCNNSLGKSVRAVVIRLPFLILDNILLNGKGLIGNGIDHITHAVRFHPEDLFKGIPWNHFIISRCIITGTSVKGSPGILYDFEILVFRNIFRALEHHMFKQVGKARMAFRFPIGTYMVLHCESNNRV